MRVFSLTLLFPLLAAADSLKEQPEILTGAEARTGQMIPDIQLPLPGAEGGQALSAYAAGGKFTVVALTSPSCPLCQRLAPTLAAVEDGWREKGVRFLYLAPVPTDTPESLKKQATSHAMEGPLLRDENGAITAAFSATSTTEVIVLDTARTVRYRGAVDDQYGLGYQKDAPQHRYLEDALKALTSGKEPHIPCTTAPGCALESKAPATAPTDVTWHNRISRIVQAHCQECHRKDGVGPFELMTHADMVSHAGMIRKVVSKGIMPPWFAAPPTDGSHSLFGNDRSLPPADREALLTWLEGPKTEGDPKDAPLPRTWTSEWSIGQPDTVLELTEAVPIKATGRMAYVHRSLPTGFKEDRWVQGFEVLPSARAQTHHILVFAVPPGQRPRDGDDFFAAYVPGASGTLYPEGFAKKLPAGGSLYFQLHYTPNGTAAEDRPRIALKFAAAPPKHEVRVAGAKNTKLSIPPGAANHLEKAILPVPADATVLAFMPHMHMRGKAFRYDIAPPDSTRRTVLDVPHYDFNWQLTYRFAEPLVLAKGSALHVEARFDNSAENPANPDPTKTVRWGPQTEDEMLIGYVEYYLNEPATAGTEKLSGSLGPLGRMLDKDGDHRVSREEAGELYKDLHKRLDKDSDGFVTREEIRGMRK